MKIICKEEVGFWVSIIISVRLSHLIFKMFSLFWGGLPGQVLWLILFDAKFNKVIFSVLVKWKPMCKMNFEILLIT